MKSLNILTAAAVLALSSVGIASAQTVTIHVSGSTAFRVAVVSAEVQFCGGLSAQAAYFTSSSSKALTSVSQSVVKGVNSGTTYVFENNFSGSIQGDENLVDSVAFAKFPTDANTLGSVTAVGTATAGANCTTNDGSSYTGTLVAPDVVFSDVQFSTAQKIIIPSAHSSATPGNDTVVGVVPFVFLINGSTDVLATNNLKGLSMDPQKFAYTWSSNGFTPLSFFTGSASDSGTIVWPIGRDVDSGTRATALAETGYPLKGNGANAITQNVDQFFPYASSADVTGGQDGGAGSTSDIVQLSGNAPGVGFSGNTTSGVTIAAIGVVPSETVDGDVLGAGNGGYYSGGDVANALSTTIVDPSTVLVSYLGVSDANSALNRTVATGVTRPQVLAYNGITFDPTTNPAAGNSVNAIVNGQYTFWTFEHLFYKDNNSVGTTSLTNAVNGIKTALAGTIEQESSFGVTLSAVNSTISRTADGAEIQ